MHFFPFQKETFVHSFPFQPKSVISVMMIITFIFEQVFCHFEGAMGFHCNREVTKKEGFISA